MLLLWVVMYSLSEMVTLLLTDEEQAMRSYREGSVSHHGKEASLARGEQTWKEVVRNAVWCLVRILTRLCRTGQGVRNLFKSKVKTFNVFKLIICPPI